MNISNQELALWWGRNIIKFSFYLAMAVVIYITWQVWYRPVGELIYKDKYNLNPRPVCAPASLNGKTVTNCIQK